MGVVGDKVSRSFSVSEFIWLRRFKFLIVFEFDVVYGCLGLEGSKALNFEL